MATVILPRSLVALFPCLPRRCSVEGASVGELIAALDTRAPGVRDRLVEAGPRLRRHIKVYVDTEPADLDTAVATGSVVHVIPAVSGGAAAEHDTDDALPRFCPLYPYESGS